MPRYLVERTFCARAGAGTATDGGRVNGCEEAIRAGACEGVGWISSFVTPDGCRSFCLVDSPSPEAIRVAGQATGLPVDRITEVRVIGRTPSDPTLHITEVP